VWCEAYFDILKHLLVSHKPGKPEKPRIVREFCKPGKVGEFEIWSANFLGRHFFGMGLV